MFISLPLWQDCHEMWSKKRRKALRAEQEASRQPGGFRQGLPHTDSATTLPLLGDDSLQEAPASGDRQSKSDSKEPTPKESLLYPLKETPGSGSKGTPFSIEQQQTQQQSQQPQHQQSQQLVEEKPQQIPGMTLLSSLQQKPESSQDSQDAKSDNDTETSTVTTTVANLLQSQPGLSVEQLTKLLNVTVDPNVKKLLEALRLQLLLASTANLEPVSQQSPSVVLTAAQPVPVSTVLSSSISYSEPTSVGKQTVYNNGQGDVQVEDTPVENQETQHLTSGVKAALAQLLTAQGMKVSFGGSNTEQTADVPQASVALPEGSFSSEPYNYGNVSDINTSVSGHDFTIGNLDHSGILKGSGVADFSVTAYSVQPIPSNQVFQTTAPLSAKPIVKSILKSRCHTHEQKYLQDADSCEGGSLASEHHSSGHLSYTEYVPHDTEPFNKLSSSSLDRNKSMHSTGWSPQETYDYNCSRYLNASFQEPSSKYGHFDYASSRDFKYYGEHISPYDRSRLRHIEHDSRRNLRMPVKEIIEYDSKSREPERHEKQLPVKSEQEFLSKDRRSTSPSNSTLKPVVQGLDVVSIPPLLDESFLRELEKRKAEDIKSVGGRHFSGHPSNNDAIADYHSHSDFYSYSGVLSQRDEQFECSTDSYGNSETFFQKNYTEHKTIKSDKNYPPQQDYLPNTSGQYSGTSGESDKQQNSKLQSEINPLHWNVMDAGNEDQLLYDPYPEEEFEDISSANAHSSGMDQLKDLHHSQDHDSGPKCGRDAGIIKLLDSSPEIGDDEMLTNVKRKLNEAEKKTAITKSLEDQLADEFQDQQHQEKVGDVGMHQVPVGEGEQKEHRNEQEKIPPSRFSENILQKSSIPGLENYSQIKKGSSPVQSMMSEFESNKPTRTHDETSQQNRPDAELRDLCFETEWGGGALIQKPLSTELLEIDYSVQKTDELSIASELKEKVAEQQHDSQENVVTFTNVPTATSNTTQSFTGQLKPQIDRPLSITPLPPNFSKEFSGSPAPPEFIPRATGRAPSQLHMRMPVHTPIPMPNPPFFSGEQPNIPRGKNRGDWHRGRGRFHGRGVFHPRRGAM